MTGKQPGRRAGARPARKPLLVLFFFLLLWLAGIAAGEPQRVLEQAIRICFSCIGIG